MEMYSLILPNIVQKKGRNFKVALLLADSIKNVVNLFSSDDILLCDKPGYNKVWI